MPGLLGFDHESVFGAEGNKAKGCEINWLNLLRAARRDDFLSTGTDEGDLLLERDSIGIFCFQQLNGLACLGNLR